MRNAKLTALSSKLAAFFLLFVLTFLLTACTVQDLPLIGNLLGGVRVPTGPATLTVWGMWENPEVMAKLIETYQEEHPNVIITYEDRSVIKPLYDYKERIFSRLGTEDGPDIARVHVSWVPRIANTLSTMPGSVMDVSTFSNTFYPSAAASCVINNQVYCMPLYYDGLVLLYNKDHFAEIDQAEPPTAWEEFRRLALELTVRSGDRKGAIIRGGAAMGTANNIEHFSDILGLMWAQAGVAIPGEIDTESAQHALTFYTNFALEDKVWDDSLPEAITAFANGQVSMIFVPSWRILEILAASPSLNFGVAAVPQALPQQPAAWGTFWVDVVSSASKNAKASWEFLDFLAQQEQQLAMFDEASSYRAFGSPYSRVDLRSELDLNEYLAPVVETAPFAATAEVAGRSGNDRQVAVMSTAVEDVLGGDEAAEALVKAKQSLVQ